jgi:putative photosynthetic complex assembly protein 2
MQSRTSVLGSLALVVGFWWAATGLTLAMQWSSAAIAVSVAATSVFAIVGAVLIAKSRTDATAAGARNAFLGSALVWWWCSSIFYAGFGVTIAPAIEAPSGSAALAVQAIMTTLRADLFGVFALLAIGAAMRGASNRVAFWSFVAFFGTLQTAKLNVFFGVRNSGVDWLPSHLSGLAQFFGPNHNSTLLPVTVLLLSVIAVALARRAIRARDSFGRHANAMLSFLVTLAVLEHVFLGLSFSLPLWNAFLVHN